MVKLANMVSEDSCGPVFLLSYCTWGQFFFLSFCGLLSSDFDAFLGCISFDKCEVVSLFAAKLSSPKRNTLFDNEGSFPPPLHVLTTYLYKKNMD